MTKRLFVPVNEYRDAPTVHTKLIINDRRTDEQRALTKYLVVGRDKFMSGWGLARDGYSWAAWACTELNVDELYTRISNRPDMRYVAIRDPRWRPRTAKHLSIYWESNTTMDAKRKVNVKK